MFYFFRSCGWVGHPRQLLCSSRPPMRCIFLFQSFRLCLQKCWKKWEYINFKLYQLAFLRLQIIWGQIYSSSFFFLSLLLILPLQSWMMQSQMRTVIWGFKRLLTESSTADTELLCWMANMLVYACLCVCFQDFLEMKSDLCRELQATFEMANSLLKCRLYTFCKLKQMTIVIMWKLSDPHPDARGTTQLHMGAKYQHDWLIHQQFFSRGRKSFVNKVC